MSTTSSVSLSGLASGIDTALIVQKLLAANAAHMNSMGADRDNVTVAISTVSTIGTLLSNLRTATQALDTAQEVGAFTATSSGTQVVASAAGNAQAGAYSIEVKSLASEQRSYSGTFLSSSTALGQAGTLSIQVGSGTAAAVDVVASDTLEQVAAKINAAGQRVTASLFYDGATYRMQLRGLDTGEANAITLGETGTALAFTTVQPATDAAITVDGFRVTRPTNQFVGAIQGLTLAVTAKTTSPLDVTVASDPTALSTKVQTVVNTYNAVVRAVHAAAGFGDLKASNPVLRSDSSLRRITDALARKVGTAYTGAGSYSLLSSVGVTVNKDGSLTLDSTKLGEAFAKDPTGVEKLFGQETGVTVGGAMNALTSVIDEVTKTGTGSLTARSDGLARRKLDLQKRMDTEQTRLDAYQALLEKQFRAMENAYGANQALLSQLTQTFKTTTTG